MVAQARVPGQLATPGHGRRAARRERTALQSAQQIRDRSRDLRQAHPNVGRVVHDLRHGPQQSARIRVAGIVADLVEGALLDLVARVHDQDPIGHLGDRAEVMRDKHDARAVGVLYLLQQVEDLRLDGHVQRGGRLVGEQHSGLAGQRHRDHDPLAHPAREMVGVFVHAPLGGGNVHHVQEIDRLLPRGGPPDLLVAANRLRDLVADGVDGIERGHRLLKDHRDLAAPDAANPLLRDLHQILALQEHPTGGDAPGWRGDHAQQRERGHALAASALADDAERLATAQREADVGQNPDLPALHAEIDAEVLDAQDVVVRIRHRAGPRAASSPHVSPTPGRGCEPVKRAR